MPSFCHKRFKGNDILRRPITPRGNVGACVEFAIRPSGRITRFRKLKVFNGGGTFYKG